MFALVNRVTHIPLVRFRVSEYTYTHIYVYIVYYPRRGCHRTAAIIKLIGMNFYQRYYSLTEPVNRKQRKKPHSDCYTDATRDWQLVSNKFGLLDR